MHASWEVQHDTFCKNVIDLCWILYNKLRMVATLFFQRTTAFTLFSIVPSLQISCFRKTKEKQYAKYDLNKRIAARLIWQLVIHSCVIFAYIISRRDGQNNGLLAGVSLPPSSRTSLVSLAPKTPFPFPFKRLPRRLVAFFHQVALFSDFNRSFELLGPGFAPYSSNVFYIFRSRLPAPDILE